MKVTVQVNPKKVNTDKVAEVTPKEPMPGKSIPGSSAASSNGSESAPYQGRQKPRVKRRVVIQKSDEEGAPVFPFLQEDPEQLARLAITDDTHHVSMFKLRKDLCAPVAQDGQLINIRTMTGSQRQRKRQILQPAASAPAMPTFPFATEGGNNKGGESVAERSVGSISVSVAKIVAPGVAPVIPGSASTSPVRGSLSPAPSNPVSKHDAEKFAPELQSKIKLRKYKTGLSPLTKVRRLQRDLEQRSGLTEYMSRAPMDDDDDLRSAEGSVGGSVGGSPVDSTGDSAVGDSAVGSMADPQGGSPENSVRSRSRTRSQVSEAGSPPRSPPGFGRTDALGPPPPVSVDLSDLDSTDSRHPLASMRQKSIAPAPETFNVEVSNTSKLQPKKLLEQDAKSFDFKAEMDKLNDPRFKKLYSKDENKTIEVNTTGSLSKQIHQLYLMTPTPLSAHQPIEVDEPLYYPEKYRIPVIQERRPGEKETIYNSAAMREATFRSKSRTGSRTSSRTSSRAVSRAGSSTDLLSNSRKQQQSRSLSEYHARMAREKEESEQAWTGVGGLSAAEYLAMSRDEIRTRSSTAGLVRREMEPCNPKAGSFADMFVNGGLHGDSQSQSQSRGDLMVGGEALEGSSASGGRSRGGDVGMSDSLSLSTAAKSRSGTRQQPRRRSPMNLQSNKSNAHPTTCRHCLREALLWCEDCKTPYCHTCWGKVPHHDYADSNALHIKTIRPVHLQYRDAHFDPMCLDTHGHLVPVTEEEAERARTKALLVEESSDFMGSFGSIGVSHQASAENVVGDAEYGFADSSRRADRDKARNGPKRAVKNTAGLGQGEGAKLTPSMVAMLSDDFRDRQGGSLASSLTGVDSITGGSVHSAAGSQLANHYLPASSVRNRAPGEYGVTLPRSRQSSRGDDHGGSRIGSRAASRAGSTESASRAPSQSLFMEEFSTGMDPAVPLQEDHRSPQTRPEFEVHNNANATSATAAGDGSGPGGSASLSGDGIYLPSGACAAPVPKAHQCSRQRLRHPHDHHEIHVSPIRPNKHVFQQEATARGASMSASRKHRDLPKLPGPGESFPPSENDHHHGHGHPPHGHHHELHLEDYRMSLHPKEFKLGLPYSQTEGEQSTYVLGPVSQHIVEAEERLKAQREKPDKTVSINGRSVHVSKPAHHGHGHGQEADVSAHPPAAAEDVELIKAAEQNGHVGVGRSELTDSPVDMSPSPSRPRTSGDGNVPAKGESRSGSPSLIDGRISPPGMDDETI